MFIFGILSFLFLVAVPTHKNKFVWYAVMKTFVKKRPHVSSELGKLVRDFHELSTETVNLRDDCALEAQLEELASALILGYHQRERVSLKLPIAAVFLEIPTKLRSVPVREGFGAVLVCEGETQYLVVSGLRHKLEEFIDESSLPWQRMYPFPY